MRKMQSVTRGAGSPQIQELKNQDSKPTLKNGQILFGKINKMYPNQMAEVQIGNQKILAHLETLLQSNGRYWFEVQTGEDKFVLKVLNSLDTPAMNGKETAGQLVSHLGVKSSTEATELAGFLIKNQLPVTKDSFQLAMKWLKNVEATQEGLIALKTMYKQQLPFIEDVFKALFAQAKGESFHGMLHQLLTNLTTSANETATTIQLKGILESLVVPKQGQIQEIGLQKLLGYWLNPNASKDIKEGALSLLQKTGFISSPLIEGNKVSDSLKPGINIAKADMATNINTKNTSIVDTLLGLVNPDERQLGQAKETLFTQLSLFSQNRGVSQLLPNERAVLQLLATELPMTDLTNPSVVSTHLKDIVKMLGLQFEHVLANANHLNSASLDKELSTLKPLLFKLLQEQQPATVKELADQIVNRITAQQIISQENGPLQNLLLTLPLQIGNHETDVTLEWSGRKRKDGSIDPDYCRVLFYLDLEQLKETVIDMQVQNRVIKISVLNEHSGMLEQVASPLIQALRNNLEAKDYKLSGVLFENTIKEHMVEKQKQLMYQAASSYSGVDVRI